MFENIKDAMTFTKGERTAIITLAAVILLIIAANFFVANRPANVKENLHNLDSIIALHEKAVVRQRLAVGHQQSTPDKDVSHELPIANIQKPKAESPNTTRQSQKRKVQVFVNTADTTSLQSLPGIGPYFARNIVSYREKLGGFVELNQMLEVYAFDSARMKMIESFLVIDSIETRKVKINRDDFKTILRHPYIEYEDVKKILNYRESKGMITNWEMYLNVVGRDDVDERLIRYLEF